MVRKIIIKENNIPRIKENVSCIGYFDGVHLGHQELIKYTVKQAKLLNVEPTLICFNPDPLQVITGSKQKHIFSFANQLKTIEYFGIKQVIIINFDDKLMKMKPSAFIKKYLNKFNIRSLICGYDFSFGTKGLGNITDLLTVGNFECIVVPKKEYKGDKISSTRIKDAISKGKIGLVNKLLGYDYYIEAKVEKCSKMAEKWLIECKIDANKIISLPNGLYDDGISISNGKLTFFGPKRLKEKTKILINPRNE